MSCSAVLPRILTSREETPLCQPLQGAVLAPKTLSRAMAPARSLAGRKRASPPLAESLRAPRPDTPSPTQHLEVIVLTAMSALRVMTVRLLATGQVPRGAHAPRVTSVHPLATVQVLRVLHAMTVLIAVIDPRATTVLTAVIARLEEIAMSAHLLATGRFPREARDPRVTTVRLEATARSAPPMVRRTTSARTDRTATRTTTTLRVSSATTVSSASAKTNVRVATPSSTPRRVARGLRLRMSFLSAFRQWQRPRPMLTA